MVDSTDQHPRKPRGFQCMSKDRHLAVASEGGKTVHRLGLAHTWTREEASQAGVKGGLKVSADREHMRRIGAKGGAARRAVTHWSR